MIRDMVRIVKWWELKRPGTESDTIAKQGYGGARQWGGRAKEVEFKPRLKLLTTLDKFLVAGTWALRKDGRIGIWGN